MTADQFWNGEPELVAAYYRADQLRQQRVSETEWLQGLYVFRAVSTALANAFSKPGTRPHRYMEEPIRLLPLTEEEKLEKAEQERQRVVDYFNRMAQNFNKKG